jgi:geranylgeranyl pyrophosphate synthase
MSQKSQKNYLLKIDYFNYLKETAEFVDPYVRKSIENFFNDYPDIRNMLTKRYRFGLAQLRPASVRLAYEIAGGKNWNKIIPACAAIEVRDTAYYCYDDVVDKGCDTTLFLFANVYISLSNKMIGETKNYKAINALFSLDEKILQAGFVEKSNEPSESECIKRATLFNFWEEAFRLGAILARADNETIEHLRLIGKNIGIAYMIANDTWDFGKEDLEDFQNGKYTLPILYAMKNSKSNNFLEDMFGRKEKFSEDEKNKIRKLMIECGAIKYGQARAWNYFEIAMRSLRNFPENKTRDLIEFSGTIIWKNKYFKMLE